MKILCYSPYNMWKLHGMWEMTILHALKLRGADFRYVMCDGVFTECDIFWKATNPRHAASCTLCKNQTEEFARNMGMPFQWIGQYLNADDFNGAAAWVESLSIDDYMTAEYESWRVGVWVKGSVNSHFRMSELDIKDPEIKQVYKHYLYSGLIACIGINRLLDDYCPDTLFLFNGRMSSTQVALSLALQKGIRTITHERGYLKESILLIENGNCLDLRPIKQIWNDWGAVPLNQKELKQITSYLRDREHGRNLNWKPFSPKPQPLSLVHQQLKIPDQCPVWVLFTTSDDEIISADGWEGVFASQHEWIARTANYIKNHLGIRLIVRIHPNTAGKYATGNNFQQLKALEILATQSSDNISFIMPEDDISSYSLMEIANIGLVYQSTVGIEMACKGKVVLVASGSMISDLPFVTTINSEDGYENILDGCLKIPFDNKSTTIARMAYRYAYGIFFRYNILFPLVGMPDPHNGVLKYTSIQDLLPNKDPNLDRIARIVLDKEQVCRPPEENEKNRTSEDEDTWFARQTHEDRPIALDRISSSTKSGSLLVSVIIPCYNYAHYLPEAVSSVIGQTFQDFEIIIVNDGSTDNTIEIAELLIHQYSQYSIKLINQPNSGHPAVSRNRGISEAQADLILPLDADDMLHPIFLQKMVDILERNNEIDIVYCDTVRFGEVNNTYQTEAWDLNKLAIVNVINYCALYRKKVWTEIGGYKAECGYEDWEFWIAAAEKGFMGYRVPEYLFYYRSKTSGRLVAELEKKDAEFKAQIVRKHLKLYDLSTQDWANKVYAATNKTNQTIRVLLVVHNFPPHWFAGVEIYTYQFAQALQRQGIEVSVLYPQHDGAVQEPKILKGSYEGIHIFNLVTDFNNITHSDLSSQVSNASEEAVFRQFLEQQRFDVIHFHHTINLSFSFLSIAKEMGYPVCVTLHDFWYLCLNIHLHHTVTNSLCSGPESCHRCAECFLTKVNRSLPHDNQASLKKWISFRLSYALNALLSSDCVVSPSRYLADIYSSFGLTCPIEISPLGLVPVRKSKRYAHSQVVFGFLGTIHDLKNVHLLTEAFKEVKGAAQLLLFGEGIHYYVNKLESSIAGDERIAYRGAYLPIQLADILEQVDIVVVPSISENYPLVVREALSAGVPVIASRVGGIPEILTHLHNGILFDSNDKEELRRWLQTFIDNPSLIDELKRNIGPVKTMELDAIEWIVRYERLSNAISAPYTKVSSATGTSPSLKVAIFSLEGLDDACAQIRLIAPLEALGGRITYRWWATVVDQSCNSDLDAIDGADLVVVQRFFPRNGTVEILKKILDSGKPVIYEADDLLFDLPETNHLKPWATETAELLTQFLPLFSAITVSTPQLKDEFLRFNPNVFVLPNMMDGRLFHPVSNRNDTKITIGFCGTNTHARDLSLIDDAIFRIAQRYGDKLDFLFMGYAGQHHAKLPGFRYVDFELGYQSYSQKLAGLNIDIALIPLEDNQFNRCKSNIKWLEYSACGIAGIYSDLPPYNGCIEHGKTSLLVGNNSQQWYEAISLLVENDNLRRSIAANARAEVLAHYSLAVNAHKWLDTYREIIRSHTAVKAAGKAAPEVYDSKPVSIIIPLFNKVEFTQRCLEALTVGTPQHLYELILIDNGSSDGTSDFLAGLPSNVKVIRNIKNQGFARACNQGAQAATGKYLLFLNNDTEPRPGWLEALTEVLDADATVAGVGSKLLYPDGTIQHAGVSIVDNRINKDPLCGEHIWKGTPADQPEANQRYNCQALTAACLLVRRDAFEAVQGFDEGYWNGYEDVDLCFKFGQKGWKLVYQPASVVIHHESKSGSERFTKAAQNIQRLHEKWLGTIQPDVIIHADSRVEWLEGSSVPTVAEPLVSIVIPLFNQAQLTKACVEAIQATTGDPSRYELILVDNGSGDWTAEYMKSLGTAVIAITNRENLGFAKACNQGVRIAKGEYLIFLNNDTAPQSGWLDALLSGAREEGADIVGAKLLYPNGRVQHAGVTFNRNGIGYHIFKNFDANTPAVNKKRFMQCVTAACMLISKQLFNDLDGFDEQFRNGFEDVDFCLRAGQAGKRILYTPDAVVIHHEEQSEGRKQHDYENMQLYLTRWLGRVRCDDEELYAAEGLSIEWHADGTCVVRPRSAQKAIHENCRYPLIPLVGRSSSSILQKLSSSERTKGVLKRYTTEE